MLSILAMSISHCAHFISILSFKNSCNSCWFSGTFKQQGTFVVCSNKPQNVLMPQHDGLVDLGFPEPGSFFSWREDFHRYITPSPPTTPDFPKTAFANYFLKDNCSSHSALDKKWQTCQTKMQIKNKIRHSENIQESNLKIFLILLSTNVSKPTLQVTWTTE